MLAKFSVSNFKGFKDPISLDLSCPRTYEFNQECIKNGVVNNTIIYGYNGIGKSNLGWAIFDLLEHLTDKRRPERFYKNYLNGDSNIPFARFEYEFLINQHKVIYKYLKSDYKTIIGEWLEIDGIPYISYNRQKDSEFTCLLEGTESLRRELKDDTISVLKYVKNNSILVDNDVNLIFSSLFDFINRMLLFKSVDIREYIWKDPNFEFIDEDIIDQGKVDDFQLFLNEAGINCKLSVGDRNGRKTIFFNFKETQIVFDDVASAGTRSLMLFYAWYIQILKGNVDLVFIDEFDAFYHYELSRLIIRKLKESGVQFIVTTHNTTIMNNQIMRPDCLFLMDRNHIMPLCDCTEKELREAHNIEKIYRAHAFRIS